MSCAASAGVAISTHAPAGGATEAAIKNRNIGYISTHAPAGGATRDGSEAARQRQYFYSRPCGRGDAAPSVNSRNWTISTHAPAGGATLGAL